MTHTNPLTLNNGDSQVLLCPNIGASIARYTWRGHSVLRPAPDEAIAQGLVRQMGVYPLVPYSNRIAQGQLLVGNKAYALRPNFPPEPHAIHGFGWQREWKVAASSADSAHLKLKHLPDVDWPFACEAAQHIQLLPDGLSLTLSVCNLDDAPMPAGLGFHPYFPAPPGTKLQADWKGMWKMGADSLPTELAGVPPSADFSRLRSIDGWKIDNCFTGWGRRAILEYPTYRMTLDASADCRQIVCYAPNDGRNFIALEPVSNINNAFALAAKGVGDTGMRMLGRGDSVEVSMMISLQALPAVPMGEKVNVTNA